MEKKFYGYTEKEKEGIVERYEQERRSGKVRSQKEYSQREGISLSRLKQWRKEKGKGFVEVKIAEGEEEKVGRYRIGNRRGIWVEFGGGFKREEILALVSILREVERC